jgi:hypothetical protein
MSEEKIEGGKGRDLSPIAIPRLQIPNQISILIEAAGDDDAEHQGLTQHAIGSYTSVLHANTKKINGQRRPRSATAPMARIGL